MLLNVKYFCYVYTYFFESPKQTKGAWKDNFLIVPNLPCLEKYFLPLSYGALRFCNLCTILWTWFSSHIVVNVVLPAKSPKLWKCVKQQSHPLRAAVTADSLRLWCGNGGASGGNSCYRPAHAFYSGKWKQSRFWLFTSQEAELYLPLVEQDPSTDQA